MSVAVAILIAGILGALGAGGAGLANYFNTKKTNEYNQQQYEDWKQYNTPSAQMERLQDAGLNPYMVNGVNNTVSQPFSIGSNQGIAEMLGNMGSGLSQAFNQYGSAKMQGEQIAINKTNAETKKAEAETHKTLAELRERMVKIAEAKKDPEMALIWSTVEAKDLLNQYNSRTLPYRVGSTFYDYLLDQQRYTFNEQMNPYLLDFYPAMQRSIINKNVSQAELNRRQISHLDWYEPWAREQFFTNYGLNLRKYHQGKYQFDTTMDYYRDRLGLSKFYGNLAERKFRANIIMRGIEDLIRKQQSDRDFLMEINPF